MSKTLTQYTDEVVAIFKEYEKTGTVTWTHQIAARDLPYQIGSLTKVLMQLEGQRHAEGQSPAKLKAKVADELADIFAEVLFIAHELDIDLDQAFSAMKQSDAAKIKDRS